MSGLAAGTWPGPEPASLDVGSRQRGPGRGTERGARSGRGVRPAGTGERGAASRGGVPGRGARVHARVI